LTSLHERNLGISRRSVVQECAHLGQRPAEIFQAHPRVEKGYTSIDEREDSVEVRLTRRKLRRLPRFPGDPFTAWTLRMLLVIDGFGECPIDTHEKCCQLRHLVRRQEAVLRL